MTKQEKHMTRWGFWVLATACICLVAFAPGCAADDDDGGGSDPDFDACGEGLHITVTDWEDHGGETYEVDFTLDAEWEIEYFDGQEQAEMALEMAEGDWEVYFEMVSEEGEWFGMFGLYNNADDLEIDDYIAGEMEVVESGDTLSASFEGYLCCDDETPPIEICFKGLETGSFD